MFKALFLNSLPNLQNVFDGLLWRDHDDKVIVADKQRPLGVVRQCHGRQQALALFGIVAVIATQRSAISVAQTRHDLMWTLF